MKKLITVAALGAAVCSANAQMYVDAAYVPMEFSIAKSGDKLEATPHVVRLILGRDVSRYLALEGMLAFGVKSDGVVLNGLADPDTTLKGNNAYGLYLKPKYPVSDNVTVFWRLGYNRIDYSVTNLAGKDSDHHSGFAYGAGVSINVNPRLNVFIDYMSYLDRLQADSRGIGAGLGFRF